MVIPGKKRLSLFTRKQQKLVNKAKKMKQTPDLSAILKGQLKSLSKKKSVPAADTESAEAVRDDPPPVATPGVNEDNSAVTGTETREEGKSSPLKDQQESTHPEDEPLGPPDEAIQEKSKKKKGKKMSRKASSKKETEDSNASREDLVESSANDPLEERPKKQKKQPIEVEKSPSREEDLLVEEVTPDDPADNVVRGGREKGEFTPAPDSSVSKQKKASGKRAVVLRSAPSLSEGAGGDSATTKGLQMNFPDLVNFSYNENTLLISNPVQCAELTRQVRGGPVALPPVENLFFRDEYIEAAHARKLVTLSSKSISTRYSDFLCYLSCFS